MSDQTDPLPPVPQHTPPIDKMAKDKFTNNWMQWFVQLRDKVNIINSSLVTLGTVTTAGFLAKLADGSWASRTFGNSTTIEFTDGDGSGNPLASFVGNAADVPYDNTTSGLSATDVQGAVDELKAEIDAGGGGGYPEGTTNPVSPALDDKFYRTDLNLLIYYDGTRWLTVNEYAMGIGATDIVSAATPATGQSVGRWPVRQDMGMYLTRWDLTTFIISGSGANFYTIELQRRTAANASTVITSANTSADAATNWIDHSQVIDAVLDASAFELQATVTKTGTPGNLYAPTVLHYRLIVT